MCETCAESRRKMEKRMTSKEIESGVPIKRDFQPNWYAARASGQSAIEGHRPDQSDRGLRVR